jgi:dTDP-4-amino-4,6-dideoxygalactose transaminase
MATSSRSDTGPVHGVSSRSIALIDLAAQQARIRPQIDAAIAEVLNSGAYIMGPQVGELERRLADFCGARHAIACSSGTDALLIALMARGIGPGDAVICPAFTYTANPEVIALLGATGIFVDVSEDTFNIDPDRLDAAAAAADARGLKLKAIIPVDLFGQPANYDRILPFAKKHGLMVLCDGAQSFGASLPGRRVGQIGHATGTSFFPAKPLGCYGDGGAIFTDDDQLAGVMRSILMHGKGGDKYDIVRVGINGRLDTIQAAILIEKLKIFPDEIERRNEVAARYNAAFAGRLAVPTVRPGMRSVWAQYTLRLPADRRDAIARTLAEKNIPTAVYYPRPLHQQPAYRDHVVPEGGAPVSERIAKEVLSLPMHPYLSEAEQDRVITSLLRAVERCR